MRAVRVGIGRAGHYGTEGVPAVIPGAAVKTHAYISRAYTRQSSDAHYGNAVAGDGAQPNEICVSSQCGMKERVHAFTISVCVCVCSSRMRNGTHLGGHTVFCLLFFGHGVYVGKRVQTYTM